MRGMTRRALAVLLSLVLVLAACATDDTAEPDDAAPDDTAEPDDTAAPDDDPAPAAPGELDIDAVLAAGTDCDPPDGDPLIIGYAADLSELGGYADQPGSEAAAFVIDLINCAGGLDGTPVEYIVQDIQGDPDVTQRAAQDLLDAGVHAMLGPPFSDFGLPLLEVVGGAVPVVSVASTEVLLSDPDRNAFLMAFDDPAQANAAAVFARQLGAETAVTLSSPDHPYFLQNPEMFGQRFEADGGELLADYTYSLGDTDFATQANQIAALDPQPDVIYTAMLMPLIGTLLGQLQSAGVEADIIGSDAFDATGVTAAGDVADGVYYTTHGFPGEGTRMKAFLDAFAEEHGRVLETVSFGTLAADAVLLIADAYLRAGTLDPAAIAEEIKATQGLELITEAVSYNGGGTPTKPVFIHQIVGGEPSLADTITP